MNDCLEVATPPQQPQNLSHLIRCGAALVKRQVVQTWIEMDYPIGGEPVYWSACTLGAACAATFTSAQAFDNARDIGELCFEDDEDVVLHQLHTALGYDLTTRRVPWPAAIFAAEDYSELPTLLTIIVTLNDDYGWSFGAIATWLESQGL